MDESASRNIILTLIGFLLSLFLTILALLNIINFKIILSPYVLSIFSTIFLLAIIWAVKKTIDPINKELSELKAKIEKFEENFKIHERPNKLELEVYNGKK